MRIDKGDALTVLNILDDHVFDEARLTGACLADDIRMAEAVRRCESHFILLRSVSIDAEYDSLARHLHRRRRLLRIGFLELTGGRHTLGGEVENGCHLRKRERHRDAVIKRTIGKIS